MASLDAYPCKIIDVDEDYFQQNLALGFQKDSELVPLFNYWIFKSEQSGDLSFWRNKVGELSVMFMQYHQFILPPTHSTSNHFSMGTAWLVSAACLLRASSMNRYLKITLKCE